MLRMFLFPPGPPWQALHPDVTSDHLGIIPDFLVTADPRPAREQFDERYKHGGGWVPFGKKAWKLDPDKLTLKYPSDPPLIPLAMTALRDEKIVLYESGFVAIIQPDGSFEVSRMD